MNLAGHVEADACESSSAGGRIVNRLMISKTTMTSSQLNGRSGLSHVVAHSSNEIQYSSLAGNLRPTYNLIDQVHGSIATIARSE